MKGGPNSLSHSLLTGIELYNNGYSESLKKKKKEIEDKYGNFNPLN